MILPSDRLARNRRYFIVGAFLAAAASAPPTVESQLAIALLLMLLYECGICMTRRVEADTHMLRRLHAVLAVTIGLAVPLLVYLMNGTVEPWALLLGAVLGFSYWYFGPLLL